MKNKKTIRILLVVALCITVIAMNSYAFWSIIATQNETNIVGSGCLDLDFTEGDAINLGSQFPISDADSESLNPYTFTITNACSMYASYQVNLEVLPVQGAETKLEDQYVKLSLNNSNKRILTEHEGVATTITEATTSYKLITGELAEDESIIYELREWIEENTPISQASTSFRSKITIHAIPIIELCAKCGTLRVSEIYPTETYSFLNSPSPVLRNNIESIVFADHKTVSGTALGSWDVSATGDNSVVAWYEDTNSNSMYEITIGGIGGVKGNTSSKSLFSNVRNLDSIDLTYFYTHEVRNMYSMFSNTGRNSTTFTLDLGDKFDTSNVTDMSHMFNQTGQNSLVFTLNLGDKFDTSNVTYMRNMFSNTGYNSPIFILDLGNNFDTSKVTDMFEIFYRTGYSSPSFTLDLRNFNVNVVTMINSITLETGNLSHKLYASSSNISFMSGKGFTGTIINCTTSPASCPQ